MKFLWGGVYRNTSLSSFKEDSDAAQPTTAAKVYNAMYFYVHTYILYWSLKCEKQRKRVFS